jgi:hypothetical protein
MRPSLLDNPFSILKVAASATNEDVVDAHDDLSGGNDVDDARLTEAKQALLSPRTRLGAELAFLTDTSEAEAGRLLKLLASSADRSGLTSAAERLSPLSRANFLVALIENFGLTDDLLVKLISAQAEIVVGDVVEVLRRVRTRAGIVTPNDESVAQALEGLFEQQARAALQSTSDLSSLAQIVTTATAAICATNDADRLERLDSVQQAYWRTVSRETAVLRSDLEAIGTRLLDDRKDADVEAYIGALRRWDIFGQPLQLLERARGRQDQEALAVQTSVRGLCLDLSNEKGRSDAALRITKAAREVFAELDRAAAILTEDVNILIGNAAFEATRPFEVVLDRLKQSLDAFARGIEAGKTGAGTEWATLFDTLAETLPKTHGQDRSWILLRSFGIDMFNATGAEGATRTFVNAVLERARKASASPDIIKRLEDDLVDLDRFGAQKRLGQAVETKKWDEALTLAKGMEVSARTPEERKEAATWIAGIQSAQNRRTWGYVKWGAAAVVGLVMIANALHDNSGRSTSSYSPPSAPSQPSVASRPSSPLPQQPSFDIAPPPRAPVIPRDPGTEVKPTRPTSAFGEQPRFSIGNIRYCLFENERLERLRSRGPSTDNVFIDRFNEAITDWNAHCSRYQGGFKRSSQRIVSPLAGAVRQALQRVSSNRAFSSAAS